MTAQDLATLLGATPVKDHWMAKCPAHEDSKPSLKIAQGDTGVLFHCWAGCRKIDILTAVGLSWRDLFNKPLNKEDAVWNGIRREIVKDRAKEMDRSLANRQRLLRCAGGRGTPGTCHR